MSSCSNHAAIQAVKAKAAKYGSLLYIDGRVCKVTQVKESRPGKHGHGKLRITGCDIVTNRKYVLLTPSDHVIQVPSFAREELTVMSVNREDETIGVMGDDLAMQYLPFPMDGLVDKIEALLEEAKEDVLATTMVFLTWDCQKKKRQADEYDTTRIITTVRAS